MHYTQQRVIKQSGRSAWVTVHPASAFQRRIRTQLHNPLRFIHATVMCQQKIRTMKLTEKQIEEIADNLDSGMRCFYNLKTGEIKTIINFDSWIGADEEPWEDELKEVEKNWSDYFEFEGFESHESFQIMVDFAESIDNKRLQQNLINALNRPKPFQNFKWQIDNSGEYRQQWFDFKKMRYIEWIKEQIDLNSKDFE